MVSMKKKNKLLVSINNYMQGMHIFNDINVNGRQTREREHCDIPKKLNWHLK